MNAALEIVLSESQSTGKSDSVWKSVTADNAESETRENARERQRTRTESHRVSYTYGFDSMYSWTVLTYWVKRFKRTDVCTLFIQFFVSYDTIQPNIHSRISRNSSETNSVLFLTVQIEVCYWIFYVKYLCEECSRGNYSLISVFHIEKKTTRERKITQIFIGFSVCSISKSNKRNIKLVLCDRKRRNC